MSVVVHGIAALRLSGIEQRLQPLMRGWSSGANGPAHIVADMLAKRLGCSFQEDLASQDTLAFKLDLDRVRLRGMSDLHCILVGGDRPETAASVKLEIGSRSGPGRLVLVCVPNPDLADRIKAFTSGKRCVVLGIEQIRALLLADDAISLLRHEIVRSLPLGSLIPYDILQSASGAMFFGRANELRRLRDEDTTSFAIAGPGKAGKTSLVKYYLRSLREDTSAASGGTFFIDLMECPKAERTDLGYASFIASRIGVRAPATTSDFIVRLREFSAKLGRYPILVLDEVDDLCLDDDATKVIANVARNASVRLLLCGKGDLYRSLRCSRSHFVNRLELLQLGPLDPQSARKLLIEPLEGLNIGFTDPGSADEIVHFTGSFAHLIQLYAKRIAERAIERGMNRMDLATLQDIRDNDPEIAQYVLSPLGDFRDPRAKLVALTLLKDNKSIWSPTEVAALVEGLTVIDADDICNELVINNVLTWCGGSFKLANQALRQYARRDGFLDGLWEDALTHYRKSRKGRLET